MTVEGNCVTQYIYQCYKNSYHDHLDWIRFIYWPFSILQFSTKLIASPLSVQNFFLSRATFSFVPVFFAIYTFFFYFLYVYVYKKTTTVFWCFKAESLFMLVYFPTLWHYQLSLLPHMTLMTWLKNMNSHTLINNIQYLFFFFVLPHFFTCLLPFDQSSWSFIIPA